MEPKLKYVLCMYLQFQTIPQDTFRNLVVLVENPHCPLDALSVRNLTRSGGVELVVLHD